jgi:hypothetical protein
MKWSGYATSCHDTDIVVAEGAQQLCHWWQLYLWQANWVWYWRTAKIPKHVDAELNGWLGSSGLVSSEELSVSSAVRPQGGDCGSHFYQLCHAGPAGR